MATRPHARRDDSSSGIEQDLQTLVAELRDALSMSRASETRLRELVADARLLLLYARAKLQAAEARAAELQLELDAHRIAATSD